MSWKAVVFDLDDTLVVDEAVSKEAMVDVAQLATKRHGTDAEAFVADARRIAAGMWAASPVLEFCGEIGISFEECLYGNFEGMPPGEGTALAEWAPQARKAFFEAVLQAQGITGEDAGNELAAAFAVSRRRLQRLMPDAREVLARLRSSYRLGLLTNGAPPVQREKIADAGLAAAFDAIIVSGEEGIGKPHAAVFDRMLARLGVPAAAAVMVGNSLQRDIVGARAAGFGLTVWLHVPGSEEHADVVPDATILGLHELPALLARFEKPDSAQPAG